MNERIKELKLQAQLFALEKCNGLSHDSSYVPLIEILMDKFAELIVKECLSVVYEARKEPVFDTYFVIGPDRACEKIINEIKERFGVTE